MIWPLLGGLIGAAIGAFSNFNQAQEKNTLLSNIERQYNNQLAIQKSLYEKQKQQLQRQAELAKTERLTQFYKQIGAQATWAAAQGIQGNSLIRLKNIEKADLKKDISIIDENLKNYLTQINLEKSMTETQVQYQVNQLKAQQQDPWMTALTGVISGGTQGLALGYNNSGLLNNIWNFITSPFLLKPGANDTVSGGNTGLRNVAVFSM